jgi:hypothetical protein
MEIVMVLVMIGTLARGPEKAKFPCQRQQVAPKRTSSILITLRYANLLTVKLTNIVVRR